MPRTPDEIKNGLSAHVELHECLVCPYRSKKERNGLCIESLLADALALIQQLQDEKVELLKIVEQLQAERDAALEDKRGECTYCAYLPGETIPQTCFDCANKGFYRWEWRGVQKEDSDDGKE